MSCSRQSAPKWNAHKQILSYTLHTVNYLSITICFTRMKWVVINHGANTAKVCEWEFHFLLTFVRIVQWFDRTSWLRWHFFPHYFVSCTDLILTAILYCCSIIVARDIFFFVSRSVWTHHVRGVYMIFFCSSTAAAVAIVSHSFVRYLSFYSGILHRTMNDATENITKRAIWRWVIVHV